MNLDRTKARHLTGKIVFIAFFGILGIIGSYELLALLTDNLTVTRFMTVKGWGFVLLSSGLLYILIRISWRSRKAAEQNYRSLFENTVEGIYQVAPDGRYISANSALARIYGYESYTKLMDINWLQLNVEPKERTFFITELQQTGCVSEFESQVYRADKSAIWTKENARAVRDAKGVLLYYEGTVEDITDRVIAQTALHKTYSILKAVVEGTTDAIFVKDLQGRYLLINTAGASFLGKSVREVLGKDDTELFSPETVRKLSEVDRRIIDAGVTETYEEVAISNGIRRTFLTTKGVYRDPSGKVIGLIGIARDISDRKQAEQALQETNQKLQAIIQAAPVSIHILDPDGNVQLWNPAAERIFGWSASEVVGRPLPIVPETKRDEFRSLLKTVLQGGSFTGLETQRRRQDSSLIDVSISTAPLRDAKGDIIGAMLIIADITERKRLEREREQLLDRLRRETEDLAALSIVTANSISTLNLEELLDVLLRRIVEVMHADTAVILLKENDDLYLRASIGIEEEFDKGYAVRIGQSFAGTIAATMQPLYVLDRGTADTLAIADEFLKTRGIRTHLGVPLKHDGTLVGVLHVDWLSFHPQSDRETHLLEIAAERCAMAILNAQLYKQTKQLQERLQLQIERMPIGCVLYDRAFHILDWNPAAETIFGFTAEEIVGQTPELIVPPAAQLHVAGIMKRLDRGDMTANSVNQNITKDGRTIICEWYNTPLMNPDGSLMGVFSMVQDVTKRQEAEEQLRRYAFYDTITGLPNRTAFLLRLGAMISRSRETCFAGLFAVLYLDLDRFNIVKYSLGHLVGDRLIVAIARRIESLMRPTDHAIARVGADEFAILLEDIQNPSDATRIAKQIHSALKDPFDLDGDEVFCTASIGIVLNTTGYDRPEDILRDADTAMHHAKLQGPARYAVFAPAMHAGAVARLQLEMDLRRAIESQQFQVYYQPIVSLSTGKIAGFEALVRWFHPTRGTISPPEFIPLAEETELICSLDRWVLREACLQLGIWQQKFPALAASLKMSVNMSGVLLGQVGTIERLDQILRETGIDGRCLKLEITESVILENTASEMAMLEQLKALGIQLSIDDFGTGYSSLGRLHQLPIDTLKIDRCFVNYLTGDRQPSQIVQTILTLAHTLGMDAIAEGVETADQLELLRSMQCEYAQGYFFSKPVDSEAAFALLLSQK